MTVINTVILKVRMIFMQNLFGFVRMATDE